MEPCFDFPFVLKTFFKSKYFRIPRWVNYKLYFIFGWSIPLMLIIIMLKPQGYYHSGTEKAPPQSKLGSTLFSRMQLHCVAWTLAFIGTAKLVNLKGCPCTFGHLVCEHLQLWLLKCFLSLSCFWLPIYWSFQLNSILQCHCYTLLTYHSNNSKLSIITSS